MPRHVYDDFSFLPTVDSTDEEIMEKEAARKAGHMPASEPVPAPPEYDEHPAMPKAPAAGWEQPVAAPAPPPRAERTSPGGHEPEQDGGAMWEDFAQHEGLPLREPRVPTPPPPPAARRAAVSDSASAATKSAAELGERPMPVPRKPEAVTKRVEREPAGPVETPPVAFGDSPKKKAGKETRKEGKEPTEDKKPGSDIKPFIAPKPPPEAPVDAETAKKRRWQKVVEKVGMRSLVWSVGAHLLMLVVAAFIGYNHVIDRQVDFLPGGGSAQAQAASAELTNKVQNKKNPWLKKKPQLQKVTVQSLASEIVLPELPMDVLDMSSITDRMDISKVSGSLGLGGQVGMGTAGSGGGFGSGIGKGGKFSFVGQTALGRHVVFVVDVSGSMSAVGSGENISRFDLLKKELIKSVNQMPMNTQFQILFFSDFAWPHDQVDSRDVNALTKYRWEIEPKDYKKAKIPTFRFIQATPFSLRETADIIQRSDNPGGTNWGSGLLMALNANPKPDVIFFMTDGMRSDEQGWVDIVTAENKRRLPMTAIYTSAMQQPDAARELDDLARRNNGRFTVVLGDGKIVKGEDFFKMKK